ncbi:GNAT family N-acetyltransferase [Phormidium tenue FACHB-886]|nr:GNAT family N-acetyltransferase [Phormidium tenue FACHB-886]
MLPITIQPYDVSYQQSVIDLILPIQQQEFGVPISIADQPDLQQIPNFYQIQRGNFWIALHNGSVVGTIALLDIGNCQAAIRKMFVHSAFRGQPHRTGQVLLDTLMHWAHQQGISELLLGTTAFFKAAHRFYEKNGFVEISPADLPASFPVMQVDSKFYRYKI